LGLNKHRGLNGLDRSCSGIRTRSLLGVAPGQTFPRLRGPGIDRV
jgi:hypothetical protein